ncbi:MAG: hypothetical protein ACYTAN_17990 [Planctomycetota bacterium]|jgi:hypothetical protein
MAKKKETAPKRATAKKPRKKRVKKDLDISIDTPKVDVDIERKDGVTTIEIDSEKFDATLVKTDEEVKVDIRSQSKFGKVLGKIVTRVIKSRRK